MSTTIQKVGEMVGIPARDTDAILVGIRANQKKLDECVKPHDFSVCLERHTKKPIENPTPVQQFRAKWGCSKCGGYTDAINKIWYVAGLQDALRKQI